MALMLPTIIRNILNGPATRMYPVQVREPIANARGHVTFNDDKCVLCGICSLRCPADAISIDKEENELTFHPARCIVCEVCVLACPQDAIDLIFKWRPPFYTKPVEVHQAKAKKARAQAKEAKVVKEAQ